MMQKESEALDSKNCLTRNSKSTRTKQTLLRHASVEARNVAAGTALELFYRLAELEAKADLLRDNLVLAGQTMADLQKLNSQGLKAPPEFARMQKQQLEMAADQARCRVGYSANQWRIGPTVELALPGPAGLSLASGIIQHGPDHGRPGSGRRRGHETVRRAYHDPGRARGCRSQDAAYHAPVIAFL